MQIVTRLFVPLPPLLYARYDELVVIPNYKKVKRQEVNVKKNRDIKNNQHPFISLPFPFFPFSPFHLFTLSPFHLFTLPLPISFKAYQTEKPLHPFNSSLSCAFSENYLSLHIQEVLPYEKIYNSILRFDP